ncbi:MAG: bifunctional homocysteine S-methyltransferase/methylenetetrahydrofolate reductase [Thermoguttaceae bacterium]
MPTTQKLTLAETLRRGGVVFDGPMGTEIYRHHVFTNRCFDELNVSEPQLIRQIHQSYRDAGADVLTTNTFSANRLALEKYGFSNRVAEINRAGVALAREVAGDECFVVGSIGPIPSTLVLRPEQLQEILLEQIDALTGVDAILFETLPSRQQLESVAEVMTLRPDVPFILSCVVSENGESLAGEKIATLLAPLQRDPENLIAFGLNCGTGPDGLLHAVEEAMQVVNRPLIVQPNAGTAREFEGRRIYYSSPEYVATYAMRFVNLGVSAVGGCCGMTPEHIAEIARTIKRLTKARTTSADTTTPHIVAIAEGVVAQEASPFADRTRLAHRLAHRQWVTTIELVPPRGYDLSGIVAKCQRLHRCGIDAINIPDGPRASSRIAPLVVAQAVLRDAAIEPILHFCCRDRNLIGMQADLLACAALNIRNLLFITGDPPKLGLYPNATGVFDTDSVGMCAAQRRLNTGIDIGGQAITPPTHAVIGVGLDPTSLDRPREVARFKEKVAAGAEFAITQPVFDPASLLSLLDDIKRELGELSIPIIAGIWPLASYRNALFMQNEVPGVVIPDATMARMESASHKSKDAQVAVGVEIARDSIVAIRDHVCGVQVSAPLGNVEIALAVVEN